MKYKISCLLGISLLAAGCSGPAAVMPSGDRVAIANTEVGDYKLGVGDKLRLTVFHEDGLSGEFAVGANGKVAFPLIGEVPAAGKTASEIAAAITAQLSSGYLRDPKVSVEVSAFRPFYILGEVKTPGTYPFVNGLTAMNAIATAQGYTPRANTKGVYIRRADSATETFYQLTPNLRIFPGDTIRLGERYF